MHTWHWHNYLMRARGLCVEEKCNRLTNFGDTGGPQYFFGFSLICRAIASRRGSRPGTRATLVEREMGPCRRSLRDGCLETTAGREPPPAYPLIFKWTTLETSGEEGRERRKGDGPARPPGSTNSLPLPPADRPAGRLAVCLVSLRVPRLRKGGLLTTLVLRGRYIAPLTQRPEGGLFSGRS